MPTPTPAGYSGTPLAKKLGFKERSQVFVSGAPDEYAKLLEPLPPNVVFETNAGRATDIAYLFVTQAGELAKQLVFQQA